MLLKRRRRGCCCGCIVPLILLAVIIGVWWYGTFTLTVTTAKIYSDKVTSPFKIVQITDLHGAQFGAENKDLIHIIEEQAPDMIFCTGDMATSGDETGRQTAEHLLSALAKKYPVYFVSGEHDDNDAYIAALKNSGVTVLDYQAAHQKAGGADVAVYGISNVYYSGTFDLANEFEPLSKDSVNILLAHIPNFDKFAQFGFDAAFCGDSHGGQVRLPFVGPVTYNGIWFPKLQGREDVYDKGLYQKDSMSMFVSSGLGNFPIPVRFLNRPEVAAITVMPEK